MIDIKRYSPVSFKTVPRKTEYRDNFEVTLEYEDEHNGPHLIDLSHNTRWDIQSRDISMIMPLDIKIPENPGASILQNGVLINRMNQTQASVWHLLESAPDLPEDNAYTNVTEATVFLAIVGSNVFSITEKLSALDFMDPQKKPPFLYQGPFSHVPCQIVTLSRDNQHSGIMLTCSRGYAGEMVHAILDAGNEFDLRPAGINTFKKWVSKISA